MKFDRCLLVMPLLMLSGMVNAGGMHKCIDAQGVTSYQKFPCPEDQTQEKVTLLRPASKPEAMDEGSLTEEEILALQSGYQSGYQQGYEQALEALQSELNEAGNEPLDTPTKPKKRTRSKAERQTSNPNNQRYCDGVKSDLRSLDNDRRKGGSVSYMEGLRRQQNDLRESFRTRCQ